MKNISIKEFLINEFLILLTLALCITNFIGYGNYWNYLLIIISFIIFFQKKIILFDINLLWLTCFTLTYVFILEFNGLLTYWRYALDIILLPAAFYILGKYFSNKYPYIKITYFIIFFLAILFNIIPLLSNIRSVIENGFMSVRHIKVIWSRTDTLNATNVASCFALNMSFFSLLFINTRDKFELKLKYFLFFFFFIGLFSYTNMMTRSGVFISIISLIAIIILVGSKQKIKYLGLILLSAVPIIFLLNLFGFFNWFEQTNYYFRFYEEIEQSGNMPRVHNWQSAFNGLFQHPLGGAKTKLTSLYAHNLWLDVGWKVGVLPLIFLLLFTYRYIVVIWRINRNKFYSIFFRSVIICVFLGFFISFFVEPVMEGLFINFCLFCLFLGVFDSRNRDVFNIINEIT